MRHSRSTIYGGNGGNTFVDDLTTEKIITRVIVRHGELVDSIQLRWKTSSGDRSGERHGGGAAPRVILIKMKVNALNQFPEKLEISSVS